MLVSRLLRALGASGLFVLLLCLASGCQPTAESFVAQIRVYRGAQQIGLPGDTCPVPLQVEVLGPERQSALGGKPRRLPVPNVRVVARPASADSGLAVDAAEAESDAAGHVRFQVTLGRRVGDQYLVLSCPEFPDVAPVTVRYVAGVSVKGGMQEVAAGDSLPEPIRIRLVGEDNQPLSNVPIYFRASPPGKAKLGADRVNTDENGLATLQMTTDPERTGRYEILAEVSAPDRGIAIRGIVIPVLAMNRLRLIIGVLGGLGIFIFGMKLMSDGLQQTAGDRLKAVLQFFTRNRVTAVFAGMVVTALIQSSSACTVMVVGFVNAGLLNLTQSIGIIFGAAIGTTVTAQMVSFKLDGLALPAIIIGVVMLFCSRRSYILGLSHAILGFGLLFFGMTMMSAELKVISDFPSFIGFFQMFDCTPAYPGGPMPLRAVLGAVTVGTVMTVIVQSSSATIGLAIALATSGLINFHTAVPLILGDNIGTTITAILASIGTNRNARQAAAANTIFKILGVTLMLGLFYIPLDGNPVFLTLVNRITAGDVFAETPENIGRHVAAAHTLFNVINVIIFLPLVELIARLCRLVVPSKDDNGDRVLQLEPHLLQTPSVALQQSVSALVDMTRNAFRLTDRAVHAFVERNLSEMPDLNDQEARIDQSQHEIIQYLVELTRQRLTEDQAAAIPVIMHCVNDVERIGDRAINIAELAADAARQEDEFSLEALNEIRDINERIRAQSEMLVDMLETGSSSALNKALKIEGEINSLTRRYEKHHEQRLRNNECTVGKGIIFVELLAHLERIADHLSNIAERSIQIYQHHIELRPASPGVSPPR